MRQTPKLLIYATVFILTVFPSLALSIVEPPKELTGQDVKTMTVEQVADYYKLDVAKYIAELKDKTGVSQINRDTEFQLLHDNFGLSPSTAMDIATAMVEQKQGNKNALGDLQKEIQKDTAPEKNYNFPYIAATLIASYLASLVLVKKKVLSLATQRKIWNMALGTFFFMMATLGILLVLRISHGIKVPFRFNMLFWHVETGIAFSVVAIFHALWHLYYFKGLFKKY